MNKNIIDNIYFDFLDALAGEDLTTAYYCITLMKKHDIAQAERMVQEVTMRRENLLASLQAI